MSKRTWGTIAAAACTVVGLAWALSCVAAQDAKDTPAVPKKEPAAVFGLGTLHEYHLEFTAKEWERMQQVVGGMRFGLPGAPPAPPPPPKPGEDPIERHKNAAFGMEFPWAHGDISEGGMVWKNAGIRYKGNASYMASTRGLKRNFKIDLDHYNEELRYHGFKTINLNAGGMDPNRGREALAYAVFRASGLVAPRTAFAEVRLTVPGKYDKELLGLYTVVEQVDKTFLKDRFKNNKGLLMKPERLRGLEYLGEDWDKYKDRYQPKHEPTKTEAQRVIDFTRLLNKGGDEQFAKEIEAYLDVDAFLRYVAVNAMVVNLDSFLMLGHNFYIYLNPETNKFVFIPWDMDLSLAGFPMGGSPEQQTDLSLMHPYPGANKLIDRLLAIKEVNERYQKVLKDLSATCFAKENLLKDLDVIEKLTKEPLERERKAVAARKEGGGGFGLPGGGMFGRSMDLRTFVEKRTDSVASQIAGKSKGYVPAAMGFGPGGPGGRPGGFTVGKDLARPLREALDADKDGKVSRDELVAGAKKFFSDCDKDNKGALDEKAIAEGLNRIFPPPPPGVFVPAPGGRPPGGPGGPVAAAIVKRAGADAQGKVTLAKFIAAAEAVFAEIDKDKKGMLDDSTVAAGINLLMPPPRVFGPGFGPPPPAPPERKPEESKKEESKP